MGRISEEGVEVRNSLRGVALAESDGDSVKAREIYKRRVVSYAPRYVEPLNIVPGDEVVLATALFVDRVFRTEQGNARLVGTQAPHSANECSIDTIVGAWEKVVLIRRTGEYRFGQGAWA